MSSSSSLPPSPPTPSRTLRVAVVGCGHGELDRMYSTVAELEAQFADNRPVDLLICCGDFQAVRNMYDLECMACPTKYRQMCSFYKYYAGEKQVPVTTLFIGGNHEASNHSQELPYGGWAAPGIWYMGTSGIIKFGGVRIGGISGIFKAGDYFKGYHETVPYSHDTLHSVNHQREFDFWKMHHINAPWSSSSSSSISSTMMTTAPTSSTTTTSAHKTASPIDVFLTHDWPEGVYEYGAKDWLLRSKPHFEEDMRIHDLGSHAAIDLLRHMKPRYWFSGHLHVKFAAVLPHSTSPIIDDTATTTTATSSSGNGGDGVTGSSSSSTYFLALDKPIPGRDFMQIIDIPIGKEVSDEEAQSRMFCYDEEWLAVIRRTHAEYPTRASNAKARLKVPGCFRSASTSSSIPPAPVIPITEDEKRMVVERMGGASTTSASSSSSSSSPSSSSSSSSSSTETSGAKAFLPVPLNFVQTVMPYMSTSPHDQGNYQPVGMPPRRGNPQTDEFLAKLGLPHISTLPYGMETSSSSSSSFSANSMAMPYQQQQHQSTIGLVPSAVYHHHHHQLPLQQHSSLQTPGPAPAPAPAPAPVPAPAPAPATNLDLHVDPAEIDLDAEGHAPSQPTSSSSSSLKEMAAPSSSVATTTIAVPIADPAEINLDDI